MKICIIFITLRIKRYTKRISLSRLMGVVCLHAVKMNQGKNIDDKTENGHILFSIKELLQFNRWTTRENMKRLKFIPDWFIHWKWINYWPTIEYTVIELYLFSSIIDKDKKFGYNNRFEMFVGFTLILIDIWRKDLAVRALFSLTLLQDDPV